MNELMNMICENTNARDNLTPELSTPPAPNAPKKITGVVGLGEMTKRLLLTSVDGRGLAYIKILSIIQDEFPGRSSIHCVRWYASKLNKSGVALPPR